MSPPIHVDVKLRVSRIAIAWIVVSHAATAALLIVLPCEAGWLLVGIVVVIASGVRELGNVGGGASTASLRVGIDRRLTVVTRNGHVRQGALLSHSYVGARITTIVWCPDDAVLARAILVLPDALPDADFRRLRIVLRYSRGPVSTSASSAVADD